MVKFAMMVSVQCVAKWGLTSVNVGRWSWKGSVVRGFLGAKIHVRSCFLAGGMSARGVVIKVIVESVHDRGEGLVLVGREFMKGWLAMLLCLCVVVLAINY